MYNHHNATYIELGKGPWYVLQNLASLPSREEFIKTFTDDYYQYTDEELNRYYEFIKDFIGDSPINKIECHGDGSDELCFAEELRYEYLGDMTFPRNSDQYIDDIVRVRNKKDYYTRPLHPEHLREYERLGWNVSRVS